MYTSTSRSFCTAHQASHLPLSTVLHRTKNNHYKHIKFLKKPKQKPVLYHSFQMDSDAYLFMRQHWQFSYKVKSTQSGFSQVKWANSLKHSLFSFNPVFFLEATSFSVLIIGYLLLFCTGQLSSLG